ncbi:MAG TPA: hypothetical protein VGG56_07895, partial [Terracidiphilus sp.]
QCCRRLDSWIRAVFGVVQAFHLSGEGATLPLEKASKAAAPTVANDYALKIIRFFLPRLWCVDSFSVNTRPFVQFLTGQAIPRQPLANDFLRFLLALVGCAPGRGISFVGLTFSSARKASSVLSGMWILSPGCGTIPPSIAQIRLTY